MSGSPTFVFVHGAGHGPECWDKVRNLLKEQGYTSCAVTLPTTSGDAKKSFIDDVKSTQDAIGIETSQGHNVIVVVHSYGGMVGQSAMKGFTQPKHAPTQSTNNGYVIGLIVMASGYAQPNTTFLDGSGGVPPPTWRMEPEGFSEVIVPARELFYHDLPNAEGDEWVARIRKQSTRAFSEGREIVYPGWQDVPVWTLLTTEDKALPVEMQRMLVNMVKDKTDITVREINSSHSPMLSRPEETVEFIVEATKAFTT